MALACSTYTGEREGRKHVGTLVYNDCTVLKVKRQYSSIFSLLLSELSIELLKRDTKVTDDQLDSRVEEADLPEVAACFDNTEDYVEKLGLSPGQQTDVMRTQTSLNSTQAGMKVALKYWRNSNPVNATFRALLLILLSLLKGDVAVRVCKYLYNKCKLIRFCILKFYNNIHFGKLVDHSHMMWSP